MSGKHEISGMVLLKSLKVYAVRISTCLGFFKWEGFVEMRKRKWLVVFWYLCCYVYWQVHLSGFSCCATRLQQMMENRQESAD